MIFSKFRLRAFFLHLCVSCLIAILSLFLVFFVWYPSPLHIAIGVTSVYMLMLAIDVIIGPLITLVIAKQEKKGLLADFIVIGVLQLAALIYGLYSISASRPVWITFDTSRFEVVQANTIQMQDPNAINKEYKVQNWFGPKYIAIKPISNEKEKKERLFTELETGIAPSMKPELYIPLVNSWDDIIKVEQDLNELEDMNVSEDVKNILSKEEYKQVTGWVPLKAFVKPMVVLLDTENKKVVDIVNLNPDR